ncbi:MAG: hypothetical protein GY871_03975 [Actinomycetales bacterium]|nr:hypothetical protein [Actinomycetales bacterium]
MSGARITRPGPALTEAQAELRLEICAVCALLGGFWSAVTPAASRSTLIDVLVRNDRNGVYTDADNRDEGWDPLQPSECWELLADALEDDLNDYRAGRPVTP